MPLPTNHYHTLIHSQFPRQQLLVIGDVMLDRYLWGSVTRISPEAPVPIVQLQRETAVAGGAANVARNLASLGAQVLLAGVTGDDSAAIELRTQLNATAIDTTALLTAASRLTTTKTRIMSQQQHMLRLDREDSQPLNSAAQARLFAACLPALANRHALVLSDYAKGVLNTPVCQQLIQAAREYGRLVCVDPKGTDWSRYHGATVITPNRAELAAATGVNTTDLTALLTAAQQLRQTLAIDIVLVTLGELGMALCDANGVRRIPARAREVFDVSGAGDTVIAVYALAAAAGLTAYECAQLANSAAGIVVGHVGTAAITSNELLTVMNEELTPAPLTKVYSAAELFTVVQQWRQHGDRIVFTNGCFDVLHAGHVSYLEQARQQGQRLIIGLNSDRSVRALKGDARPVNSVADRAAVLAALASVDAITVFDEDTPLELICAVQPEVLVKGADYRPADVIGASELPRWGGELVLIPLLTGRSSSAIIARLTPSVHTD